MGERDGMRRAVAVMTGAALLLGAGAAVVWSGLISTSQPARGVGSERVRVVFSGGHETNPTDRGRPVILIAGALGVSPEVFREAFSGVQPAGGAVRPTDDLRRRNRDVLMAALGPHGVTNERLDEVSNYYRYQPQRGEMWPTDEATAYALLQDGLVTGLEIVDGGSGYSSPPEISVPGAQDFRTEVTLRYGRDLSRNGAVVTIALVDEN
jgi:hypothetical protein